MLVELACQLINLGVNRSIHVCLLRGGMQLAAGNMYRCFGNMLDFLHAQYNINLVDSVKELLELGKLGDAEFAQS